MNTIVMLSKKIINNPFLGGSLIMLIGSNLFNFGQFIYHFLVGRLLGKVLYGDLAAIISILGIVGIIQMVLGLTIVKYVATSKDKKETNNFIKWFDYWSIWLGLFISIIFLVAAPFLAKFLNIHQPIVVYLLSPLIFFFMVTTTGRSILQGLLQFKKYTSSLIFEVVIKIILTLIFVLLGWAIYGVMAAFLLSVVCALFITRKFLAENLSGKRENRPATLPMIKYSSAVFTQGLALTSMYSIDLLLVKHFFSGAEAGIYASLAILGRVVFFGASPITSVMFPIIAKRHTEGQKYLKIFILSLFLVALFSLFIIGFYFYFPHLSILVLFGKEFIEGSSILWLFAVFMSLLSLAMLFTQFFLSVGRTKIVSIFVAAALLQIILIWFNHESLINVIQMGILSAALLDLCLIVYFIYAFSHRTGLQTGPNN